MKRRDGARWLALLAGAALVTRLPAFVFGFFSGDEATYSALAVKLLSGALPYAGAVDHKPPGMELTYAAVYALVGPYRLVFVRALTILVVAATGWAVGASAVHLSERPAARLAGVLYVLASMVGLPRDLQAANSELFLNLPLALAGFLTASALARGRRGVGLRLLGAGLLTGVAALFKYQAALAGCAWAIAVIVTWRRDADRSPAILIGRLGALLLGFLAMAAAFLGFFVATHTFADFVQWGWAFNFQYMATLSALETAENALLHTLLVAAFWTPLLIAARWSAPPRQLLALSWLGAMILAICAGGRFFLHYYLMALPPLCVLAEPGIAALWRNRALRWSTAALLSLAVVASWVWVPLSPDLRRYTPVYQQAGGWVRAHAMSADRLFVWGNSPELYYYSGLVMGTRFPFCNYHSGKIWGSPYDVLGATGTEAHQVPAAWTDLLADLGNAPPRFVADAAAGRLDRWDDHPIARYPELARFVAAHYQLTATVAGVPIYTRVD